MSRGHSEDGRCGRRTPLLSSVLVESAADVAERHDIRVGDVAKQRGPQQNVGRRGEEAFRLFASRHGAPASRLEEDIGFDFACMVAQPGTGGMNTISGTWLGVSVRSTKQRSGRVQLDRSDAEAMLCANFPVCFVLVEVQADTERLWYRFLDEQFAQELSDFLVSERKNLSLTPRRCRPAELFRDDLDAALRGNRSEQVRLAVARHRVKRHLVDAALHIERSETGEITVVAVPDFFSLFRRVEPADQKRLYAAIFGSPALRLQRLADIGPRPELLQAVEGLPSPLLIGGTSEDEIRIVAENQTGPSVATFHRLRDDAHTGWVHPAGFSITISDAVRHDDQCVHEITVLIDEDNNCDLRDHPELWEFLEHCDGSAVLYPASAPDLRLEAGFVSGLREAAFFARCLRAASGGTSLNAQRDVLAVPLRHCREDEVLHTLAWLAGAATQPQLLDRFGFVLDERPLSEMGLTQARADVPVVANLGGHAVVTWLESEVTLYEVDDQAVGIRFNSVGSITAERRPRADKDTAYPELVVHGSWPVVALGPRPAQSTSNPEHWDLEIRFRRDDRDADAPSG